MSSASARVGRRIPHAHASVADACPLRVATSPLWAPRLSPRSVCWRAPRKTPVRAAHPRARLLGRCASRVCLLLTSYGSCSCSVPVRFFDLCRLEDSHTAVAAILAAAKQPPVFAAATVHTPSALPPVLAPRRGCCHRTHRCCVCTLCNPKGARVCDACERVRYAPADTRRSTAHLSGDWCWAVTVNMDGSRGGKRKYLINRFLNVRCFQVSPTSSAAPGTPAAPAGNP